MKTIKQIKKAIEKFKKTPIENFNPYQATELPSIEKIRKMGLAQVGDQVWAQVGDQVGDQVRDQVWDQVWDQVGDQVWDQVWDQVRDQVWDQVRDQVRAQVGDQVRDQVWAQVWATSYWGIKIALNLPIKHWFFDFLKLGVMIIFVQGKIKVFGKQGKYLGEYDESELTAPIKKRKVADPLIKDCECKVCKALKGLLK